MTLEKAKRAIRHGAVAGTFLALVTAGFALVATFGDLSSRLERYDDPWLLVDALIIATLTYGLFRRSRIGGVGIVLYYTISQVQLIQTTGGLGGLGPLIWLFFFIRAAYGTIVYARIMQQTEPAYGSLSTNKKWLLGLTLAISMPVFAFGLLITGGIVPDSKVVSGTQLGSYHRNALEAVDLASPDDTIILFYSDAMWSIEDDGQFFTQDKVVSYWRDDSGLSVYKIGYSEIISIDVEYKGAWPENTILTVTSNDGDVFRMWVSPENGLDSVFFSTLVDRWRAVRDTMDFSPTL